jgi:hypothetical protein
MEPAESKPVILMSRKNLPLCVLDDVTDVVENMTDRLAAGKSLP